MSLSNLGQIIGVERKLTDQQFRVLLVIADCPCGDDSDTVYTTFSHVMTRTNARVEEIQDVLHRTARQFPSFGVKGRGSEILGRFCLS